MTMGSFDKGTMDKARENLEETVVLALPEGANKLEEFDVGRQANMLGVEQGKKPGLRLCAGRR